MFCSEPFVESDGPIIIKQPPAQLNEVDLEVASSSRCDLHKTAHCRDVSCLSINAYRNYLTPPCSTQDEAAHLSVLRLEVVTVEGSKLPACLSLIAVTYSLSLYLLKVDVIGLDQPGYSHSFRYSTEQFNDLKQKHGLNVSMPEFVRYLGDVLQMTYQASPESVWYSLKLVIGKASIKLMITENRTTRFLPFLQLESTDLSRLVSILSTECFTRWRFAISLVNALAAQRQEHLKTLENIKNEAARTRAEILDLQAKLQTALSQRNETDALLEQLQAQRLDQKRDFDRTREKLQNAEIALDQARESLKSESARCLELSAETHSLKKAMTQLQNQLDANTLRFSRSKEVDSKLAHASAKLERDTDLHDKLMAENASLTQKLTETSTELVELRRTHAQLKEAHQVLVSQNSQLTSEKLSIEDAYAAACVKGSEVEPLQRERDDLQQKCAELQLNCDELRKELRALNAYCAKRVSGQAIYPRPPPRWQLPGSPRLNFRDDEVALEEDELYDRGAYPPHGYCHSASLIERSSRLGRRDTPPSASRHAKRNSAMFSR